MVESTVNIFYLDSDFDSCDTVNRSLEKRGISITCFLKVKDCLASLQEWPVDVLVIDLKEGSCDGLAAFRKIKSLYPLLPIICVSGNPGTHQAVQAVKAGAVDYLEKPLNLDLLMKTIDKLYGAEGGGIKMFSEVNFTSMEIKILKMLVGGENNQEIAQKTCRSSRTIEDHRRNIMDKLGTKNFAELVRLALKMGLTEE